MIHRFIDSFESMSCSSSIQELLAPHVEDDDVREYIKSIVEEWDEESDREAFGDMLLPLLEGEGCGQPAAVVDKLWGAVEVRRRSDGKSSSATFVPLAEGPTLLDSINKIQLHPHDEARLKQGSRTITDMSDTFTVSSEKDLQRLEKLEKKQKEKQLSAYVEHRRQMEETMAGALSVRCCLICLRVDREWVRESMFRSFDRASAASKGQ